MLSSCTLISSFFNPYRSYQNDFDSKYERLEASTGNLGDLFDYRGTSWDEMHYYGAYSFYPEDVEDELGITIPYLNGMSNEGDWVLLFLDNTSDVYTLKYFINGNGYEIEYHEKSVYYPESTYEIKNNNGFIKIELRNSSD